MACFNENFLAFLFEEACLCPRQPGVCQSLQSTSLSTKGDREGPFHTLGPFLRSFEQQPASSRGKALPEMVCCLQKTKAGFLVLSLPAKASAIRFPTKGIAWGTNPERSARFRLCSSGKQEIAISPCGFPLLYRPRRIFSSWPKEPSSACPAQKKPRLAACLSQASPRQRAFLQLHIQNPAYLRQLLDNSLLCTCSQRARRNEDCQLMPREGADSRGKPACNFLGYLL